MHRFESCQGYHARRRATGLPAVLAHGALGQWDELVFLGIFVLFALFMVFTWLRSRNLEEPQEPAPGQDAQAAEESNHFPLT